MTPAVAADRVARLRRYAGWGAIACASMGALVMAGWIFDLPALKSVAPHLPTMKVNTALGFVLSGLALWLLHPARRAGWARAAGAALALAVAVIGLLTLAEYAGLDLRIDELLMRDDATRVAAAAPGRPSPITALTFVLVGAALLALRFEDGDVRRTPSQWLALAALVTSSLGFLSYLYGASVIRRYPGYSSMALHTAVTFVVLAISILFVRGDRGVMRALTRSSPGGLLARRVVPTVIAFAVFLGWLRLQAQRAGILDTEAGLVVMVLGVCIFVIAATMIAARQIDTVDAKRERAAQSEAATAQRLTLAVRAGAIGIWDWNTNTNEIAWDDQMHAMYGVERGAPVVYKTWSDAVLPEDLAQAEATLQRTIADRCTSDNHFRIRHPVHGVRHIAASEGVVLDASGGVAHVVGVNRDITPQRDAEARAAAAVKELEAFSYSVAHDLRAPLRAMNGFSQILLSRNTALDGDGRECLEQILEASRRMGQLVDDLLSLSKVSRTELHRERVDLSQIVRDIVERLCHETPGRAVDFVIKDGVVVQSDSRLLTIALENLVGNAWKYTSKRPSAHIEFGMRPDGSGPTYFVRDDGDGFDMAHANKLFAPFQRLHDASEFEGTGIGLATVQRIVQRLGGTIKAEGRVGAGATFSFTLG